MTVFIFNPVFASNKTLAKTCEKHLISAATLENVPLGLLYAIALTETGVAGKLNPYALNVDGKPHLAQSQADALAVFEEAAAANSKLVDVGCMQINYRYHHDKFQSVNDMLDPEKNVHYAAKFLRSLKQRHGSWTEAVARYHAGPNNKVAQHRYVCRVLTRMVETHFGNWTPAAQSFCNDKAD
jgi:soluble lytic murein transglycosylase-like protein